VDAPFQHQEEQMERLTNYGEVANTRTDRIRDRDKDIKISAQNDMFNKQNSL
jgi:hypothetical protein